MQAWERNILEYRPTLGFTPDIQSFVLTKPDGSAAVYRPSGLALQATQILGSDILDNTMATLSRANDIMNKLDRCMSSDPVYAAYKTAKNSGDDELAGQIHRENLTNIEGNPQVDAIPILQDAIEEMKAFLDYVNRELFDGKADLSDMEDVRESEEKMISTLFYRESTGKTVDYNDLRGRIRMIAACMERMQSHQFTVDRAENYLLTGIKETIDGDSTGLVYYLATMDEAALPALKETIRVSFTDPATQSANTFISMDRTGDADFRAMLDSKLSSVKKANSSVYNSLISYYADDTIEDTGASILKEIMSRGIESMSNSFEQLTVDHMTNSIMNRTQLDTLFSYMTDKKKSQLLYQLIDRFADEFDPVDLDKEVARFIKHTGLNNDGTLCG